MKNINIGLRIAIGFAIVLVFLGGVAFIGYSSLDTFSRQVTSADATNRLVKNLLAARMEEKNFIIRREKSHVVKARAQVTLVHEEALSLKESFKSDADKAVIDGILEQLGEYHAALDSYVSLEGEKSQALQAMLDAARQFVGAATELSAGQRARYEKFDKEVAAMAKTRKVNLAMAERADKLLKSADEVRRGELEFLLSEKAEDAHKNLSRIDQLVTAAEFIKALLKSDAEKKQGDAIIKSAKAYKNGFVEIVDTVKAIQKLVADRDLVLKEMENYAKEAERNLTTFMALQKLAFEKILKQGDSDGALKDRYNALSVANQLAVLLLNARIAEKAYIREHGWDQVAEVNGNVDEAIQLADALKAKLDAQMEKDVIDQFLGNVGDYRKALDGVSQAIDMEVSFVEKREGVLESLSETAIAFEINVKKLRSRLNGAFKMLEYDTVEAEKLMREAQIVAQQADQLIVLADEARLNEKNFLLRGDASYGVKIIEEIGKAKEVAAAIGEKLGSAKEKKSIEAMLANAQAYLDAFAILEQKVAAQGTQNDTMVASARAVNDTVVETRTKQKDAMEVGQEQAVSFILLGSLGALLAGVVFAWFTGRSISVPIGQMIAAMRRLADNDLNVDVPAQDRKDEIGAMAGTVEIFKTNAIDARNLRAENEAQQHRVAEEKKEAMHELADGFERSVKGVVNAVSSSASEMNTSAQSLSAIADQVSNQAGSVAAATEQATANVETAAAAAEQLSASIDEIARQVSHSSETAASAVREVESTGREVQGLADAAQKIGDVVSLITDIAEQTNLLALNATIEAARAGDAGKGFAVVAAEVKNLANQTAKATDEIGSQIGNVQAATKSAVGAIDGIGKIIGEMNEISTTISASVEEQGAATQEIARNVQQAAAGNREVAANVADMNRAATEAGNAAQEVLSSSHALTGESETLRGEVDGFISHIRNS